VAAAAALSLALGVSGCEGGAQPDGSTATPTPAEQASVLRGPTRIDDGVPLGFARSEQGAVAAAVNFASVLTSQRIVSPKAYTDAVEKITAPESKEAEVKKAKEYLDTLESQFSLIAKADLGFSVAIRYAPFTHQVASFDQDEATVKVWGSTVLGIEQSPVPVELWGTSTYKLRWVDDDWRIVEQKQEPSTTVPKLLQQVPASTTAGLPAELGGFEQALLYGVVRE
jgi:hypothetical protein